MSVILTDIPPLDINLVSAVIRLEHLKCVVGRAIEDMEDQDYEGAVQMLKFALTHS